MSRLHKIFFSIFFVALFLCESATALVFRKGTLKISGKTLNVEIAQNQAERSQGLMFRRRMKANDGMIFIFENEEPQMEFWMKNTFIPLSIGFFDKDKKLVDVQDMEPVKSEMEIPKTYRAQSAAMYALEVNSGWFRKNKIKIGDVFSLKSQYGSLAPKGHPRRK